MWDLGLSELLFFSSMSAPASAPASVFALAFFVGFKTWETLYVYGRLCSSIRSVGSGGARAERG